VSLIDEALKRARLDTARAEPQQRRGPYPWAAAHGGAHAVRRSRSVLLAGVFAGALGAALLGGAGLWLAMRHGSPPPSAAAAAPASAGAERTVVPDTPGKAAAAEETGPDLAGENAGTRAPLSGTARSGTVEGSGFASQAAGASSAGARAARAAARAALEGQGRAAARSAAGSPGAAGPPSAAGSPGGSVFRGSVPQPAADPGGERSQPIAGEPPRPAAPSAGAGQAPALADGREYSREVTLPGGGKLALSGIAFSEHQPVAVINGRVVGLGEVVSEFTVARIQPDRVELRGRGLSIFLLLN
jgi:hypothetical protein